MIGALAYTEFPVAISSRASFNALGRDFIYFKSIYSGVLGREAAFGEFTVQFKNGGPFIPVVAGMKFRAAGGFENLQFSNAVGAAITVKLYHGVQVDIDNI